jgi:carbamoyl-phosphate synthase large subunit
MIPNDERVFYIRYALKAGISPQEISSLSNIDRWFIDNLQELVKIEEELAGYKNHKPEEDIKVPLGLLRKAKENGFSDRQLAFILNSKEEKIRDLRKKYNIKVVYKLVDTCAGGFAAKQPYFYSTYEVFDESRPSKNKKVVILGGGPNRIGQGIEFDYCCCHAAYALKDEGIDSIMVNCNPETVSTDYDTSDRLYFEPLTFEDIMNIIDLEKPMGVVLQFGGQTPLNLALPLRKVGVNILGTSAESIDIAEDRKRFKDMLQKLALLQPENGTAFNFDEAKKVAKEIGYPVLVRPSYVLGGRAMEIAYDDEALEKFIKDAAEVSGDHPVLIDKFLEDAIEVDVDLIGDGETFVIGGIMEHIEYAGVHSGDAAISLPTYTLSEASSNKIRHATYEMAKELKIVGLMNIQYAVKDDKAYVLEVNPRASRTIPFVSKAIGVPLAKLATKVLLGRKLKDLGFTKEVIPKHISIKESVFPFNRFPGVDVILGPEMKSTGEVMGIDKDFGRAYIKSQLAAGQKLPKKGNVFISVRDKDKRQVIFIAKKIAELGFNIYASSGTANVLRKSGIKAKILPKIAEGRPNILDLMKDGKIQLLINTPSGRIPRQDEIKIRSHVILYNVPYTTSISAAQATVNGIEVLLKNDLEIKPLQAYHRGKRRKRGSCA